jgi:phage-related minor tail protein
MTIEAKLRLSTDASQTRAELKAVEKQISDIRKAGISSGNRSQLLDLQAQSRTLRENLRGLNAELGQFDKANRQAVQRNIQLGAQLQDFAVQVQAGQNPLTAFIQQGSQLSFIYGGAGNALKAVTALFTPLVIGATAGAAGIGLLAAAWLKGQDQSVAFNRALLLTGGYAGITAGQFESMAGRIGSAVDGSIGGAKETLLGLVSTGKFTSGALEPVAVAIEKVAALTGKTREKVVEEFSAMADGGVVKFAEKLNASYNFLDLKTYDYIKALVAQGNESKAQVVLAEALNQSLGKVTENLGSLEKAWRSIGKAASEAWDAFLGIGRDATVEERIAQATAALAEAQRRLATGALSTRADGGRAGTRAIEAAQAQLDTALEAKRFADRAALRRSEDKQNNELNIAASNRIDKLRDQVATNEQKRIKALEQLDKDALRKKLSAEEKARLAEGINKQFATSGGQLTRLASAKRLYDGEIELAIDAAKREQQILQQRFDAGLVDLQAYLAEKRRLQDAEADAAVKKLQAQLDEEIKVRNTNAARQAAAEKRGDKNAIEQASESVLASNQKINELTTQITIKERERVDNARQLTQEAEKLTKELAKQQRSAQEQTRRLLGTETREQRAQRIREQFAEALAREKQLGGDGSATQGLIDATLKQGDFAEAENKLRRSKEDLDRRVSSVRLDREAGLINEYEAEKKIYDLQQQALPELERQLAALRSLADGFADDTPQAKAVRDLEDLIAQLAKAKSPLQQLEKQARDTAANGFSTLFSDIVSGAKTAGEAFRDFVGSIAKYVLDVVAKKLGQQLAESLIPKGSFGSGGGGLGGFLSSVFSLFGFHAGGVVRPGGQTFTRALPMALAASMATAAPHYHGGGIAGFKPNEVPAVLEIGEEVLTRDDPRHIANYRAQRGGVSVQASFTFNGARGSERDQQAQGEDLLAQIETVVDAWALKNKRPGGMLAG